VTKLRGDRMAGGNVRSVSDMIRQAIANGPAWMNQRWVARRAGISEKHLSQIVRGAVGMSARVAVRLERPLGVPALDLMVAQGLSEHRRS